MGSGTGVSMINPRSKVRIRSEKQPTKIEYEPIESGKDAFEGIGEEL